MGICPVVREIVREFAFLCGNFLKNLATANFLRFWVNFGLFCVFKRFFEFLKELDNFSSAQVVLGFFGGCSLFSGGFINYVLFRAASAFSCIFLHCALFWWIKWDFE